MNCLHLLSRAALVCVLSVSAHAAEQAPRWELGIGAAGVSLPDYRGSDESRAYVLPFPYVAYRLDWLKADRNGMRATLFDSDRVELNLSLGATPPVNSSKNRAREGMPDIKPMLEFGPSLDINVWRNTSDTTRVDLRLPLRAALEARSNPRGAGWVFAPRLNIDFSGLGRPDGAKDGWKLGFLLSPMFADKQQNAYFYTVDEAYARADRPAYQAQAGYAGTQFLGALSRRFDKLWVGAYARYDNLRGAAFADSPLVKRTSYLSYGIAFTWTFAQSSEMVSTHE